MSPGVALVVAGLLLIANAFFVAVEFGLIATQRSQLEAKANDGNRRARRTCRSTDVEHANQVGMGSFARNHVADLPSIPTTLPRRF